MSTADILSLVSTICFVLAGVFLLLTAVLWFGFKIPGVISDLTGRTARRSIAKLRAENARKGGAARKKATPGGNFEKRTAERSPVEAEKHWETSLLTDNRAEKAASEDTVLLSDPNATELLADPDATELLDDPDATELLVDKPVHYTAPAGGKMLHMLDDVMLIHTDETIG